MKRFFSVFLSTILSTLVLTTLAHAATQINGAGATFPFPLYSKWFDEYRKVKPEVMVNYNSIGSGGGIKALLESTVDFGASDAPMTAEEMGKATSPVIHVPTVIGAVVMTYNLPTVTKILRFSGDVIADIYLGKITKWNDPRLVALNKDAGLPNLDILAAYRSDGSGTTAIFTDYLAKVSPDWKSQVGAGKSVSWPTGLAGKGNEGVSGLVKQTPGAIGYVELIFASSNKLPVGEVKNKAGEFVTPSTKSVTAAAAAALKNMPEDFRVSITDAAGKGVYPLASFTYILVSTKMGKERGQHVVDLVNWVLSPQAQKMAEPLHYSSLPKSLVDKVKNRVKMVHLE